jgi:hypothetical protein
VAAVVFCLYTDRSGNRAASVVFTVLYRRLCCGVSGKLIFMKWNLQNVRGNRLVVKEKINSDATLPKEVKDLIVASIDDFTPDVTGCKIDAYCQQMDNPSSMTVTKVIQFSLVGIKL